MWKRLSKGVVVLVLATGFLSGCGDSVELRMQRAQIALSNGKPEQALTLADSVLKEKPADAQALECKARAQMQLLQLSESRKTIEALLAAQPESPKARQLLSDWTFRRMGNLLSQSDFVNNEQAKTHFDEALLLGQQQADWLEVHAKDVAGAFYLRARFSEADAIRLQAQLKAQQNNLTSTGLDGPEQKAQASEVAKRLRGQIDSRFTEARAHLAKVMENNPKHFEAAEMSARLLTRAADWPQIWILANQISQQKEVPVSLYEQLAIALMKMPSSVQSMSARLETAWKIQAAVDKAGKELPAWKVTSARIHLAAREYAKAQSLLEAALKARPKDIDGRYLLAQAYFGQANYKQAKTTMDKLATEQRLSAPIQMLYGMILWKIGDTDSAREFLRRASDLDPTDPAAQAALVQIMAQKGQFSQAGGEIEESYQKNPTDARLIRLKMQFLQVQGQRPQLEELLARVEKIAPLTEDHVRVLVEGNAFLQHYEKAERWAKQLVELRPDALESHLQLAEARLMLGQDEQVKQMLTDLKAKFPNASSVNQMLGRLYLQRGSFDRSNELLQSVVEAEPSNLEARLLLARSLASVSLMDDALEQVNKVLEQAPDDVRAHSLAARIYQFMGQPEKVSQHLGKIDEKNIDERTGATLLAQLRIRVGADDEAAAVCNRAIAAGNTDPTLRLLLAEIYTRKKDFDQAESNLVALVRGQPKNSQAWVLLARYYVDQKQIDRGLNQLISLQGLPDPAAEPLARLGQAALLTSAGRSAEAIGRLAPVYEPLIKQRSKMALTIADGMARIHLASRDVDSAYAVYEPLKAANFNAAEAALRQMDLKLPTETPEQIAARLSAIAAKLTPDETRLRYEVMNRFAALNRFDMALKLLDEWIAARPNDPLLLRWKGDIFIQTQKPDQAIAVIQQGIKLAPDNAVLRERLAVANVAKGDYPAAEAALREMAKLDTGTRISALASLGQLFIALGLKSQAVATFEELERAGRSRDGRLLYAIGQSYAGLGRDEQAMQRLGDVPTYAPQYVGAQILMARLEQRTSKIDQARQRLEKLARDPQTAAAAGQELLKLNLSKSQEQELINWSDRALNMEKLPEATRRGWLQVRAAIAADHHDWKTVVQALDGLTQMDPNAPQIAALQAAVLLHLDRPERASTFFKAASKLNTSPLLMLAAGQTPESWNQIKSPLALFAAAMIQGDLAVARSAAEQIPPMRTLYRSDLLPIVSRADATSPEMVRVFRDFGLALVAAEAQMPQLAEDLCNSVINRMPSFAPGYGLLVQMLLDQGKPVDAVLRQITATMPNSTVALFLSGRQKAADKNFAGAAEDFRALLQREPQNDHARYSLAQLLQANHQIEPAITELQSLRNAQGSYQVVASNDMAYLLAEHDPQRRDEALQMAQAALKASPGFSALQDTVGWIEHLRGQDGAALILLNQAVQALQEVGEVHYHLGVVYQGLGNKTWARYHFQEAAAGPAGDPSVEKAKAFLGN